MSGRAGDGRRYVAGCSPSSGPGQDALGGSRRWGRKKSQVEIGSAPLHGEAAWSLTRPAGSVMDPPPMPAAASRTRSTFQAKTGHPHAWFIADVEGKTLGRAATKI